MVFPEPQWTIRAAADQQSRLYGYIDNTLTIYTQTGKKRSLCVDVPTELFPLLEKLLTAEQVEEATEAPAVLYLDQLKNGSWLFGVEGPKTWHLDLWAYRPSEAPPWVELTLSRRDVKR